MSSENTEWQVCLHMGRIIVEATPLKGVYVIEPHVFGDERGYFFESYNERDFQTFGLEMRFVQDNQSMSTRGVLRGMHFQKQHAQGKLVRTLAGSVYDVVVDIRPGSETYGKWFGVELSEDNHRQLYIEPGFAHGYLALTDKAVFAYKTTDYYHPEDEGGLLWNDPEIGIHWPCVEAGPDGSLRLQDGTELTINERDRHWPTLAQLEIAR